MKRFFLLIFVINSCSYPELVRDEIIYENNFESSDLTNIDGGGISLFNDTSVLGDFNNDGFTLHINDVGEHDYFYVSFDLYIHGSWDGNFNGFNENDKPDKWIIEQKPDIDSMYKDINSDIYSTTFSNSPCWPNYCLRQSYPEQYPYENVPKTGAFKTGLNKKCFNNFFGDKTTLYKIEKMFSSSGNAIILRFYDELYQPNAIDKDGVPQMKCDESWSLDNLKIRVLRFK